MVLSDRFIFSDNEQNPRSASAPGKNIKKGQPIGKEQREEEASGDKASNKKGEEFYEVEITLEELAYYLFNDLELPDLEKKTIKNIVGKKMGKISAWYDNEWGFSNRMCDIAEYIHKNS